MIPPTSQNPPEFAELLALYKKESPKRVLEIGSHEGGTLYYWLKYATPGTTVASIDNQRINSEHYSDWCAPEVNCVFHTGLSQTDSAFKFAQIYVDPLDWLFIDGGHSYYDVSADFYNYKVLMNKHSVIAFHDILSYPPYNSEVSLFWDEIKEDYDYEEFIHPHHEWEKGPGIGVIFL